MYFILFFEIGKKILYDDLKVKTLFNKAIFNICFIMFIIVVYQIHCLFNLI